MAIQAMKMKLENPEDVTAADLNAVLGWMKHNGITALPVDGSPLKEVADKIAKLSEFPFAVTGSLLHEDDPAVKTGEAKAADA